jgi:hypothetical protein
MGSGLPSGSTSMSTKCNTYCLWNGHLFRHKNRKGKKKATSYAPFALYGEKFLYF